MYQPYYIVGGIKITPSNRKYKTIRKEDEMSERFASHSATTKQIREAYKDYVDSLNY